MPARPSRARRLGRGEPDWPPPSPSGGLKTYAQPTPKQRPSTSQTKAHNQPLLRAVLDGQKISLSIYGAVKTAGGGSWNSLSAPGTPAPACPTATASSTSSTARSSTSHTDPCATLSDPATAPHDSGDTLRLAFRPGVWLCQHRF